MVVISMLGYITIATDQHSGFIVVKYEREALMMKKKCLDSNHIKLASEVFRRNMKLVSLYSAGDLFGVPYQYVSITKTWDLWKPIISYITSMFDVIAWYRIVLNITPFHVKIFETSVHCISVAFNYWELNEVYTMFIMTSHIRHFIFYLCGSVCVIWVRTRTIL